MAPARRHVRTSKFPVSERQRNRGGSSCLFYLNVHADAGLAKRREAAAIRYCLDCARQRITGGGVRGVLSILFNWWMYGGEESEEQILSLIHISHTHTCTYTIVSTQTTNCLAPLLLRLITDKRN